jgi:hypothetical protein
MRKFAELTAAVLAAITLLALMPPGTAQAQSNFVSYVSGAATTDGNPCTFAQPCLSIGVAVSRTETGGTVRCLDAAERSADIFPTVTITRSMTIDCEGIGAAIRRDDFAGADTGFVINGANIVVVLRGLNLDGSATASFGGFGAARIGVNILQAQSVRIEKSIIQNFTTGASQGIRIAPTSGFTTVTVTDTVLSNNGLGIFALGAQGVLVNLRHVEMYNNSFGGFKASGANGGVFVNVVDSTANSNGTNGFVATGGPVVIDMQRSNASLNQQAGILADGAGAKITIGASTVTANGTGFATTNGGAILSYGDNRVDNNTVDGTASGTASTR